MANKNMPGLVRFLVKILVGQILRSHFKPRLEKPSVSEMWETVIHTFPTIIKTGTTTFQE